MGPKMGLGPFGFILGEILVEELLVAELGRAGPPGLNSLTLVSNAAEFLVSGATAKKKKKAHATIPRRDNGETASNGDG